MKDNFPKAIEWLLIDESGEEAKNDPSRPAKRFGVSLKQLAAWTGRIGNRLDELSKADAIAFLRVNCWNAVRADDLPSGLDYWFFDICYRFDPASCRRWYLMALGFDGIREPDEKAVAAVAGKMTASDIIRQMDVLVRRRLKVQPEWGECAHWWTNRANRARDRAVKLAQSSAAPLAAE